MRQLPARHEGVSSDDQTTLRIATLGSLVRAPAIIVAASTPLREVRRLLVEHRVPAIAVADRDETVRGVITRTDVLRYDDLEIRAGEAMSGFVIALTATSSIEKAAALMAYEGVGQVIVTSAAGGLLGMVSAVDIARHLAVSAGYLAR
jgi:CBS domain-containing protein